MAAFDPAGIPKAAKSELPNELSGSVAIPRRKKMTAV
ncbi:MAG: hypothetical protein ACJAT3_002637 [Akkermansiaceae bacterium]|jgi:hypothetical protein